MKNKLVNLKELFEKGLKNISELLLPMMSIPTPQYIPPVWTTSIMWVRNHISSQELSTVTYMGCGLFQHPRLQT